MRMIETKNPEYRMLSNRVLCFIGVDALFSEFRIASQKEIEEYKTKTYKEIEIRKCSGYIAPIVSNPEIIKENFFIEDRNNINFSNEIIKYASERGIFENDIEVLKCRDYIIITSINVPTLYLIPLLIAKKEKDI